MKILLQLVKPKYFIPVHGEYRQLFRHSALAEQLGAVGSQIFLLESGQPVEFTADGGAHRRDPVVAGRVMVDSGSLEEIEEVVIRDPAAFVGRWRRGSDHGDQQAHRACWKRRPKS